MEIPLLIALGSQLVYSSSDLLARHELRLAGFAPRSFMSTWFALFLVLRVVATAGQLFVFATTNLGRTAVIFGAGSIILANVLGLLLLQEVLSLRAYAGVALALAAFLVIGSTR